MMLIRFWHRWQRHEGADQLKRAVASLEEYESKLHLMEKHIDRMALIQKIENQQIDNQQMQDYLEMLKKI